MLIFTFCNKYVISVGDCDLPDECVQELNSYKARKKKAEKKLIQIRDEFINKLETIATTKTEDKKVLSRVNYIIYQKIPNKIFQK